jgi:hypothetical protein
MVGRVGARYEPSPPVWFDARKRGREDTPPDEGHRERPNFVTPMEGVTNAGDGGIDDVRTT